MMRITFVCLKCQTTVRRETNAGKSSQATPRGGVVKCPKGHGPMVRKDGYAIPAARNDSVPRNR
jgi:hypothetical protein